MTHSPSADSTFVVRGWDTPSSIALRFGVDLDLVLTANPWMHAASRIIPGTTIIVPSPEPPACDDGIIVTVESGQNLFVIADKHGVDIASVILHNPQVMDPNTVRVGQKICIPLPVPPTPPVGPCKSGLIAEVAPGDSLWRIALRHGLTMEALLRANPQVKDPGRIAAGQQICIPLAAPPECVCGAHAIVLKGETLESVALEHGIGLADLLSANPQIKDRSLVAAGQVVCVPGKQKPKQEVLEPIPRPQPKPYDPLG